MEKYAGIRPGCFCSRPCIPYVVRSGLTTIGMPGFEVTSARCGQTGLQCLSESEGLAGVTNLFAEHIPSCGVGSDRNCLRGSITDHFVNTFIGVVHEIEARQRPRTSKT
jgi:hypothetical protein